LRVRLACIAVLAVALGIALAGCAGRARKPGEPPATAVPVDHAERALAELAARVGSALPDCPVAAADAAVRAVVPAGRLFEADSAVLRADIGAALGRLAHVLRNCRGCTVEVVGHTDAIGPATANLQFSSARADALAAWMQAGGVPAARLHARGAGEGEPVAEETTPAGRQANRRIEIIIRP
jgi:outer membrane protein OmpA-like peptidoglycan-associated protein